MLNRLFLEDKPGMSAKMLCGIRGECGNYDTETASTDLFFIYAGWDTKTAKNFDEIDKEPRIYVLFSTALEVYFGEYEKYEQDKDPAKYNDQIALGILQKYFPAVLEVANWRLDGVPDKIDADCEDLNEIVLERRKKIQAAWNEIKNPDNSIEFKDVLPFDLVRIEGGEYDEENDDYSPEEAINSKGYKTDFKNGKPYIADLLITPIISNSGGTEEHPEQIEYRMTPNDWAPNEHGEYENYNNEKIPEKIMDMVEKLNDGTFGETAEQICQSEQTCSFKPC